MTNVIALDCETTTHNKGNLHDQRNELVCYSCAYDDYSGAFHWDAQAPEDMKSLLNKYNLVVGFNWKFDLGWLKKVGVDFDGVKFWDVQIAEFILSYQRNRFPSLNDTCLRYNIPTKLDVVKTEYWEKGVDTRDIPWDILSEYAAHDAAVTLACYHAQLKLMSPGQIRLCQLMCQDMVVLQEMENNGITLDEELCKERCKQLDDELHHINKKLQSFYPNVPINFSSGQQISAFLYGGTIVEETKVHDGYYKTGLKKGLPKLKNQEIEHILPRLFEPLKGSEMQKDGVYAVDEGTLRKLKGKSKDVVPTLLRRAKLNKLRGTYYEGLPALIAEMHWPSGKLHGSLNQTLAQTGRLSSSRPNQQNFASELQDIFITDYR